jgi:hypothetical protein
MKIKNKLIILLLSLIVIITLIISLKATAVLEYYVWNLSSESYNVREENANKIISLGKDVIPKLLSKLDSKYIYETDYVIYCLEEITNERGKYNSIDSAIIYWKNWGRKNNYIKKKN